MAQWTVASSTFITTSGSASTERDIQLTIVPAQGFSIEAKNFKIGGGVETNGNQAAVSGTNIWEATDFVGQWNADSRITKVMFTDVLSALGPNNTVLATVAVASFTPSADVTLFIDIDENPDNPINAIGEELSNVSLTTTWDYSAFQEVTHVGHVNISAGFNVVTTDIATGDSSGSRTMKLLSGTMSGGKWGKIGTVTFEANAGYYYNFNDKSVFSYTMDLAWLTKYNFIKLDVKKEYRDNLVYNLPNSMGCQ